MQIKPKQFIQNQSSDNSGRKMAPNKPEESARNVIEQPLVDYKHFVTDFSLLRGPSAIRELSMILHFSYLIGNQ